MKSSDCCMTCNRSGKPRPSTEYACFTTFSLNIGCTFNITMKSTAREKHMPKIVSAKSRPKHRYKFENHIPVLILKAFCDHVEGCSPGSQQQTMTRSCVGRCVKRSNETVTFPLCDKMCHNGHLAQDTMKSQVKPIWPHSKNTNPQDLFNIRIRIKRLLPIIKVTQ